MAAHVGLRALDEAVPGAVPSTHGSGRAVPSHFRWQRSAGACACACACSCNVSECRCMCVCMCM